MKNNKKIKYQLLTILILTFFIIIECPALNNKIRQFVDTVGFAHKAYQIDSVMSRIQRLQREQIFKAHDDANIAPNTKWKTVISPHDDYSYVGYLYPAVLSNIKAKTIILIGVAHKARQFGLRDQLIFESFEKWDAPYGPIAISPLRENIKKALPGNTYQVNDSMHAAEHSLEALLPFLQYYNQEIEIVPILVPYMKYQRMQEIAKPLADAIGGYAKQNNWEWGKDFAIVISNDAVHYGDEGWGDKDFAYYGADSTGYKRAVSHEYEIINECLVETINNQKIVQFTNYTIDQDDYKEYKWTWCGRYSVPFGLFTSLELQKLMNEYLYGTLIDYSTSIANKPIPVDDIDMGVTAPANIHHWVGYVAIGYQ